MRLCDGLEAVQKQRRGVRLRLNRSSLDRLTSVSSQAEVSAAWQRVCDHFQVLYDTPETLPDLRQTILQLAVQGKLVKQDPNDEPAEELLKIIAAEKQRLIENGTIRGEETLHRKAKAEPPFDPPANWKWVRFRDVIWCFRGHNPPKSEFVQSPRDGYVRFVQITDFKTDTRAVYVPETPKLKRVYKGEIIMAAYRHIGKLSREMEGAFNVALCKILEIPPMDRDFVELLIGTSLVKGELLGESERGHIPSMHSDHLLSLWFPIPPLPEQKRIVSKVTDLLSQVTRLESTLTRREATRTHLLTAAIQSLLEVKS